MKQKGKGGSYELTGSSKSRNDDRGSAKAKMIRAETNTGTSVKSVVMQKSAGSLHSSDRFEGILKETVGVKLDGDPRKQKYGSLIVVTNEWAVEKLEANTE